ncbi:MAG: metal ABC transporter solute-binding protein, Zn/Mn family [Candidatus Cyclobacteriaceae bacterium M2_1C_046]
MDIRIIIFAFALFISACVPSTRDEDTFYVVTTTGMIEDAVQNIGGPYVEAEALMGPGIDPHLYKATQGDLQRLRDADLILYNGLQLEGKMGEVLKKMERVKPVVPVADGIPEEKLNRIQQYNNNFDPHVWFDASLWKEVVKATRDALIRQDSAHAQAYRQNADNYLQKLDSLHEAVKQQISTIPRKQRVLITAHDAFGYFGEAYDIQVKGLQGISTLSEPGIRDIKELVDFIVENNIKAVFVETSVSEKAIRAVVEGAKQRGFDLKIGGSLYSDAMGEAGTPEGTYIGMVNANVQTIVEALK